jgi:hypothetical protein
MDFSGSYVDFDCTLGNPFILAMFLVVSLAVALGASQVAMVRASRLKRVALSLLTLLGAGLLGVPVGRLLFVMWARFELWRVGELGNPWTARIGCMQSAPSYAYPVLTVVLFLALVGVRQRRRAQAQ